MTPRQDGSTHGRSALDYSRRIGRQRRASGVHIAIRNQTGTLCLISFPITVARQQPPRSRMMLCRSPAPSVRHGLIAARAPAAAVKRTLSRTRRAATAPNRPVEITCMAVNEEVPPIPATAMAVRSSTASRPLRGFHTAVNMCCEIMNWPICAPWRFDRHGDVKASCLSGSAPDTTYNCVFQRRPTGATLMPRRTALTKLPHRKIGWARQFQDYMHLLHPKRTSGHHADAGA